MCIFLIKFPRTVQSLRSLPSPFAPIEWPARNGGGRRVGGEDGRCTRKSLPPPHAPATREKVRKPGNRASRPAGTPAGPGSTQTWASWGRNSRQRLLQAPRFLGPRGEGRTACESRGRAHWGGEAEAEGSAAHSDRGAQTKKCAWNRHAGRPAAQPVPCPGAGRAPAAQPGSTRLLPAEPQRLALRGTGQ